MRSPSDAITAKRYNWARTKSRPYIFLPFAFRFLRVEGPCGTAPIAQPRLRNSAFRLLPSIPYFISCLLSLLIPPPAAASPPATIIARTAVTGNRAISTSDILELTRMEPGNIYDRALIDQGMQRLLEVYAGRGHLWAEIQPPVVGFSVDSSSVDITLHIREGPTAEIERIEMTGSRLWTAETLLAAFDSRPGAMFDMVVFERDMDRLLTRYEENGYPYCRVELTGIQAQEGRLSIAVTVDEGPFILVDGFRVEGNTQTRPYVVTRELRIRPGDPFNQRRLTRGRERLLRLGLFDKVGEPSLEVNTTGDGGAIVIRVEEARSSAIDGVLGYTPGIGGRSGFVTGVFTLSLRNIAGTGRRVHVSWLRRDPLSSDIQIQYEEPWVLGHPVTAGVDIGQTNQDSSYTATQFGARISLALSDRIEGFMRIGWRRVIPDSLSTALLSRSREVSGRLGITMDTRDQPQNPQHGSWTQAHVEYGLRWNGSSPLFTPERSRVQTSLVRVDMEQYTPLFRRHVAAIAVHGMDIRGGETLLPISQQFRFGGARTLRGYRENELRGSRVAWSNLEYRFLLSSRSRFFFFFDTGYFEFKRRMSAGIERVRDMKIGYGFGIRLESSLGIVGIDYGIGEDDTLLNGKVHFGLRNEF